MPPEVVKPAMDLPSLWLHLWPGWDALWPNILASIICGIVVWLWARRHIWRLHQKLDRIHQHMGIDATSPQQDTKPPD